LAEELLRSINVKSHKLLSVGAVISMLALMPATADAQRGGGRSRAGHGVRSVGGSGVVVGGPVVRGTVVRPAAVRPHVIVRQPIVAGSVSAGHFGRTGFGRVPGFGTFPVRTGFEVGPVGTVSTGFVHTGAGFIHSGTGFVHARPVPGRFVRGSRQAFVSKGFREHKRGQFFWGGVVGYPVYPYYPGYAYPYVYPQYDYPTAPDYYPPQTYSPPQTYGGDYGAAGVAAGLSTYFMELGNQNQAGFTFDVWPVTAEVFVDGVYVGIVQDFSAGRALTVVPGTHRIDLQAAGFRTATFDVALAAGQVVPYQGELQPLRPY
jgi:PEGA domain-containing protein